MIVEVWSDYLCPWCHVARHRAALLVDMGATVVHQPHELHPEIGPAGRAVRPDGRLGPTFDRIEAECRAVGLPFTRPARMPNTRRALATATLVRDRYPQAFERLHGSLFDAQFSTGEAIDDPAVLDHLVEAAGAPAREVRIAVDRGDGEAALRTAADRARELGITSTPAWVFGDGFVVPGVPDPATFGRWAEKLLRRAP